MRSMRARCCLVGVLLLHACFRAEIYVEPQPDSSIAPPITPPDAGSFQDSDATSPPPDADASPASPPHHAACKLPSPAQLPAEPTGEGIDRIRLNNWQDVPCLDTVRPTTCDDATLCPGAAPCLRTDAVHGVCQDTSADETIPFFYRDGGCHRFVSPAWKRSVCCFDVVGADCRTWPFEGTSAPGEPCATHQDCESGLLCIGHPSASYAVCGCPGVSAEQLFDEGPSCARSWLGAEPTPSMEPEECHPALNGYVVQALPREAGTRILATTPENYGGTHVLLTADDEGHVKCVEGIDSHWTAEDLPVLAGESADIATLHNSHFVAILRSQKLTYLMRQGDGSWTPPLDLTSMLSGHARDVKIALYNSWPIIVGIEATGPLSHHVFALSYTGTQWIKKVSPDLEGDVSDLDLRTGPGQHVLLMHEGALRSIDLLSGTSTWAGSTTPARFVELSRENNAPYDLEWVTGSPEDPPEVILDQLNAAGRRRVLWTGASSLPDRLSMPSAMRSGSDREKLFVAFRTASDALRTGIFVREESERGHGTTVLAINEPYEPHLLVDQWDNPHVYYEARRPHPLHPGQMASDIRQVFRGECPTVRHASCDADLRLVPSQPQLQLTGGRPRFDLWRDLACESVEDYPLCQGDVFESSAAWSCDMCWASEPDGPGVCSPFEASHACEDQGPGSLSLRDGTCRACAPREARARACCAGLPGFDCRAWPYDATSRRGDDCARHEDCEPGLLCASEDGLGGRCMCPDEQFVELGYGPQSYCGTMGVEGGCRPANATGFAYDVVPTKDVIRVAATATGNDGGLYAFVASSQYGARDIARWQDGVWSSMQVLTGHSGSRADMLVDAQGRMHIALLTDRMYYVLVNPDGSSKLRELSVVWTPKSPAIALTPEGAPVITFYAAHSTHYEGTVIRAVALRATDKPFDEPWSEQKLLDLESSSAPFVDAATDPSGRLQVLLRHGDGRLHYVLASATEVHSKSLSASLYDHVSAVVDDDGRMHEWIGVRRTSSEVTLHQIEGAPDAGQVIWSGVPSRSPRAHRKTNGELVLLHQDASGISLRVGASSTVTDIKLSEYDFAASLLIDRQGRTHVFSEAELPQWHTTTPLNVGISHYYTGACPAMGGP